MDCPVIAIRHNPDGHKDLAVEYPVGDWGYEYLSLSHLVATKLMQELISPQRDGAWSRIAVRG